MSTNGKADIYEKLNNVRRAVDGVEKNGWNDFHNYEYAKATDVINAIRNQMNEEGITIYPTGVSDVQIMPKEKVTKSGEVYKDGHVEHWTQHYRLVAESDGSYIEPQVRCAGEDKGDKSAYKGNTGALKYLFITLALLDTEDDPERTPKRNNPKQNGSGGGSKVSQTIDRFKELHGTQEDGKPPWNVITEYVKQVSEGQEWKITELSEEQLDRVNQLLDQKEQARQNGNDPEQIAEQAAEAEEDDLPF